MKIIEIKNASYSYIGSRDKVLSSINCSFEAGKFYAITGKSGAGKSTFLSLLAGLDRPSSGEICFNGKSIALHGYSNHRRDNISLVFQNYNLIDYLTPLENVRLVNRNASDELLLKLGLNSSEIKRNVMKLSGGQQQRVAIARAICKNPDLLLCDEPTGALDYGTSKEILRLIEDINNRYCSTIVIVTHNVAISQMAHQIINLHDGRIRSDEKNACRLAAELIEW